MRLWASGRERGGCGGRRAGGEGVLVVGWFREGRGVRGKRRATGQGGVEDNANIAYAE